MKAAPQSESTSSSSDESLVETLLYELLELPADRRPAALVAMAAQYPELADVLQRRLDLLAAELPPARTPEREEVFGRFQLLRRLGGGMAEVFLAIDPRDDTQVVVKILRHPELSDPHTQAAFEREALAASRLQHPCLCPVLEVGKVDGTPYLVQPYVAGLALAQWIHRRSARARSMGPADVDLALGWLEEILRALHAAHQIGLVHRDVKPANILIPFHGPPKLLDFGLCQEARAETPAGTATPLAGTLPYMAPELLSQRERPVGPAADIYALGVTLFECVALRLPFGGDTRQAVCRAILLQDPPDLRRTTRDLPRGIHQVLACALAKSAWERYPSAAAFADDLARLRRGERVQAPRRPRWTRLRRWATTGVGMAVMACAVMAGLAAAWLANPGTNQRRDADLELLAIPGQMRAAEARAADLVPAWPEQIPALSQWLAAEGERLAAWLPRLRARVSALDTEPAEEAATYALRTALVQLDGFAHGERGALAIVRARLAWARQVTALTIDGPAALWQTTAAEVAADPRYHGLVLVPQLDLVPLGRDPTSGLFEFYHPRSALPGTPPVFRDAQKKQLVHHHFAGLVFVLLPGAHVVIGQQSSDPHGPRYDPEAGPFSLPCEVDLVPFFVSKYECTRAQWRQLTGEDPSAIQVGHRYGNEPPAGHRHPVDSVSALQCDEVLRQFGLQLPTEAQWEYACGTGAPTMWFFGDDPRELPKYSHMGLSAVAVGSLAANPFGLHDVFGNVSEWCQDLWGSHSATVPRPGDGLRNADPGRNAQRAYRGSKCRENPGPPYYRLKTSSRPLDLPDRREEGIGLRPARRLQEAR